VKERRGETLWVNFTNISRAAFTRADPEITKKTVKLSGFFALLRSVRAKDACRILMKLPLGVNLNMVWF